MSFQLSGRKKPLRFWEGLVIFWIFSTGQSTYYTVIFRDLNPFRKKIANNKVRFGMGIYKICTFKMLAGNVEVYREGF